VSDDQELHDYLRELTKAVAKGVYRALRAQNEGDLDSGYNSSYNQPFMNIEYAVNDLKTKLNEINNSIQSLNSAIYSLKEPVKEATNGEK